MPFKFTHATSLTDTLRSNLSIGWGPIRQTVPSLQGFSRANCALSAAVCDLLRGERLDLLAHPPDVPTTVICCLALLLFSTEGWGEVPIWLSTSLARRSVQWRGILKPTGFQQINTQGQPSPSIDRPPKDDVV